MLDCTITDERQSALTHWLFFLFPNQAISVSMLAGDASFRRYFRAIIDGQSFVVMDAPPSKENCDAFIAVAKAFENAAIRFPKIISMDISQGFLLLSDFGDQQLLPILNAQSVDGFYHSAMQALLELQKQKSIPGYTLPHFDDAAYWREFDIFDTWYIKKNLGKQLSDADEKKIKAIYQWLIDSAHAQPQVFVHRDYHSRNLMLCEDGELGILDFQDALMGPITYDLVSLLRDCYVAWPVAQTEKWVFDFYNHLGLTVDFSTFLRWFDLMGLQRHLKCLGIFSRLYFRDGKAGYLKEIPRVLDYVRHVCGRYPELGGLLVE